MVIKNIQWKSLSCGLKKPFKTALRTLNRLDSIQVIVTSDTGEIGIGGCAPTAAITGETSGSIDAALKYLSERITGIPLEGLEPVLQQLNLSLVGNTSAKAAIDIAVHDLYSRQLGIPLYQYLGGFRSKLSTDLTISLNQEEEMAADSVSAIGEGFKELKIKVGTDSNLDVKRLIAVRNAVGPDVKLKADANQGWKPKEAVMVINQVQKAGVNLLLIEQPVAAADLDGMKFVRENIEIPVIADESVFSPEDAFRLAERQAADGINIKLMKCGGIFQARKIAAIAEASGLFCMIGAMMESHAGITAAAHFAASQKIIREIDLDVPLLCSEKVEKGGIMYDGPEIRFPDSPGLGISL